jgi:hypothetical protein
MARSMQSPCKNDDTLFEGAAGGAGGFETPGQSFQIRLPPYETLHLYYPFASAHPPPLKRKDLPSRRNRLLRNRLHRPRRIDQTRRIRIFMALRHRPKIQPESLPATKRQVVRP